MFFCHLASLEIAGTIKVKKEPAIEIYTIVDKLAEFPGGLPEMYKYLGKNAALGSCQSNPNLMGCATIVVRFVISEEGNTESSEILKSVGCEYFENSIRIAILKMPQWKPALLENKPVKSYFKLPLKIRIE